MLWRILVCLGIGYVFGCISTAYFVGKANHIDIRAYGSGNAGTTNAMRTLGKKAGVITFLGDFLKALLPILAVKYLIFPDMSYVTLLALYTGLGIIIGHNYPFWLKFKGGKGIAATGGIIVAMSPITAIIGIIVFIGVAAITKYVSLASMSAVLISCAFLIFFNKGDLHFALIAAFYVVIAFWRHRHNIERLLHGTENRIGQKKEPLVSHNSK